MAKQTTTEYLATVFAAARSNGGAFLATVSILRDGVKSNVFAWKAGDKLDLVKREYQLGHLAGILSLDRAQSEAVFALSVPPKDKPRNDKHRNAAQQLAYTAAISAWYRVAVAAGMPKVRKVKGARPAASNDATKTGVAATKEDGAQLVTIKRTANLAEVGAFAQQLAALMTKFIARQGEGTKYDGYHAIFTDYIKAVAAQTADLHKAA